MKLSEAATELKYRREARGSLLKFVEYTHPNWQTGVHHKLICEHLEAVERGDIKRLMIFAPPRHSKSELASKRFPAWYIGRHPEHQIICCSHTAQLASDFGADVRDMVADPIYRCIFPGVVLNPDSKASYRWRTTQGGIYIAIGVDGAITGRGANIAIIDDPVSGRNDAESPRMREVAWRWYLGDLYQRLMPDGAIVLMMTRWHEDDLAARAIQSDKWAVLELPAITGDGDGEKALWPEWWPIESLREKRRVMTEGGRAREWYAQYQQKPVIDSGNYMQREWFAERWNSETLPKKLNYYICSDFAVTESREGRDNDYTEHGVFGIGPDDSIYVVDWWSGRTTPDIWIDSLLDLVVKWKPSAWYGEAGVIRRSIEPFLDKRIRERKVYFRKVWKASTRDKGTRGRAFQGRASMKKIVFPITTWAEDVINQCVAFPMASHDDKFDTMSLMCSALDEVYPAMVVSSTIKRPRDSWRGLSSEDAKTWKTI